MICCLPCWRNAGQMPSTPGDLKGAITLKTDHILSGVITLLAAAQFEEGIHLFWVLAEQPGGSVSLEPVKVHPGKCVSSNCSWASSRVLVHRPSGNLSMPNGPALALSRTLDSLETSAIASALAQYSRQDRIFYGTAPFWKPAWSHDESPSHFLFAFPHDIVKSWLHHGTFFLPD